MPRAELNGFDIYWDELGSGEPILVLHGASDSAVRFERQLPLLARDFRVIAPDLRGMGRGARPAHYLPSDWIADLTALLDHLGLESTHVYGVSLGARVALRLAIDHPNLVRSLILDAPIIANEATGDAQLRRGLDAAAMPEERRRAQERYHGPDWQQVVAAYAEMRAQPEFQAQLDLREPSKSIRKPTLIWRGDADNAAHPLRHAVELHENIPGSWLWIRPNTSGSIFEDFTEEACAWIRSFRAAVGP
ncbi:MAG TPA: alpha/beta hydrolase [Chloroflexota bacterium]